MLLSLEQSRLHVNCLLGVVPGSLYLPGAAWESVRINVQWHRADCSQTVVLMAWVVDFNTPECLMCFRIDAISALKKTDKRRTTKKDVMND